MIRDIRDHEFDRVLAETSLPMLIEFWKPGCGACQALLKELERVQQETVGRLLILKMNVEENYQIPAELEITSLPALTLYRNGEFDRFIGGLGTKAAILANINLPD
jgi:thioredoxin-like negative regulator of GroEL